MYGKRVCLKGVYAVRISALIEVYNFSHLNHQIMENKKLSVNIYEWKLELSWRIYQKENEWANKRTFW